MSTKFAVAKSQKTQEERKLSNDEIALRANTQAANQGVQPNQMA